MKFGEDSRNHLCYRRNCAPTDDVDQFERISVTAELASIGCMRVLQVIPSVSPVHGGPSRAIVDIERALAARGIEVTTVTTNDDGDARTLAVPCGVPVATPFATRWYFPRSTVFFKVSVGLGRWLRENIAAFDVVHAHALFSFAPVAAAFLARRAGVPYVLRPLGVLAPYGMTRHHPFMKKASFALIERRLLEFGERSALHELGRTGRSRGAGAEMQGVSIPLGIDLGRVPNTCAVAEKQGDVFNLLFYVAHRYERRTSKACCRP